MSRFHAIGAYWCYPVVYLNRKSEIGKLSFSFGPKSSRDCRNLSSNSGPSNSEKQVRGLAQASQARELFPVSEPLVSSTRHEAYRIRNQEPGRQSRRAAFPDQKLPNQIYQLRSTQIRSRPSHPATAPSLPWTSRTPSFTSRGPWTRRREVQSHHRTHPAHSAM